MVQQNIFQKNERSHLVNLNKNDKGSFGICIVNGEVKDSQYSNVSGIFIKDIVPKSPADMCGKLKIGDRILSLNNKDVRNATEDTVISLIKQAGRLINLEIQTFDEKELKKQKSILRQPTYREKESEKQNSSNDIKNNEPENESDEEEDTRDMAGKMYTAAGFEIDRASAGNVKQSKAEKDADTEKEDEFGYTTNKVKKKYGHMGKVLKTEIIRPHNTDLGLALAGHRNRQKMASFIAGVNPAGICVKADLKAGDEILEVNGIVLIDRCHLNASVVFNNLPGGKIVFIVIRHSNAKENLSVKPLDRFPAIVDETEYLFTAYKNVKSIQIQKTGVSIGIMIIEGKHVEVGSGIFISDLQAGSPAEEAGLKVGDLILAINKDVIVESTYDMASAILKRAKGVVTITLCSLKSEAALAEEKKKEEEKKKAAAEEAEKPQDPAIAEIRNNRKILIEFKPAKKALGCVVVGGKNNLVTSGVVITHIYPDSPMGQDNRLKVFDQILDINSTPFDLTVMTTLKVHQAFNLPYEKVTMSVWRSDPPETESIVVDVMKKPGKEFGLSLAVNARGVTITEITPGNYPEIDGKLQRGDVIQKLNDDNLEGSTLEVCYSLFKAATGKTTMHILRPKPGERK